MKEKYKIVDEPKHQSIKYQIIQVLKTLPNRNTRENFLREEITQIELSLLEYVDTILRYEKDGIKNRSQQNLDLAADFIYTIVILSVSYYFLITLSKDFIQKWLNQDPYSIFNSSVGGSILFILVLGFLKTSLKWWLSRPTLLEKIYDRWLLILTNIILLKKTNNDRNFNLLKKFIISKPSKTKLYINFYFLILISSVSLVLYFSSVK